MSDILVICLYGLTLMSKVNVKYTCNLPVWIDNMTLETNVNVKYTCNLPVWIDSMA